jgi:hypothetical protein
MGARSASYCSTCFPNRHDRQGGDRRWCLRAPRSNWWRARNTSVKPTAGCWCDPLASIAPFSSAVACAASTWLTGGEFPAGTTLEHISEGLSRHAAVATAQNHACSPTACLTLLRFALGS